MLELRFPCEISARYVIPAVRLMIAKKLIEEHNLTQSEVAELLGVTQPSISHYLNSKRGIKTAKILSKCKKIRDYVDVYIEKAVSRGSPPEDTPICMICELAIRRITSKHGVISKPPRSKQ